MWSEMICHIEWTPDICVEGILFSCLRAWYTVQKSFVKKWLSSSSAKFLVCSSLSHLSRIQVLPTRDQCISEALASWVVQDKSVASCILCEKKLSWFGVCTDGFLGCMECFMFEGILLYSILHHVEHCESSYPSETPYSGHSGPRR